MPDDHRRVSRVIARIADLNLREHLGNACAEEEPVVFESDGDAVRGMLYLPSVQCRPAPAVLIAHGFTGSRNGDTRLLTWMARAFGHTGIAALTIDFRGSGESEGDFVEMTPETEIVDARRALDLLAADERIDDARLGMVGHSLGGLVTACASGDDDRLKAIALWAAVGDTAMFLPRFDDAAANRTSGGWDVGGLEVGTAFAECVRDMVVQERYAVGSCPTLILHGEKDESVPEGDADLFAATAEAAGREHEKQIIAGGDHCFRNLDVRTELISRTLRWFCDHLGGCC